jgi:hypothetical protein
VTAVRCDGAGVPQSGILEAVHSRCEVELDWRKLQKADCWQIGWR